ncbi:DUF1656 domain-containing protein [Pseudoxanthobacter sp.]|uniref:DUF1656 domain-containing protein n=1 Tax=Pseudoxanthobacter sp. TaxID=1925742 RepID=UPI002FE0D5EB
MDTPSLPLFHTLSFFGFYLPPGFFWALAGLPPYVLARWAMGRFGLYRYVWHRSLFNLALYVIVTGAAVLGGGQAWR